MIYLHIGLPRTGTTSIQIGLALNRTLLQDAGYFFPKEGINHYGHHNIFYDLVRYDNLVTRHLNSRFQKANGGLDELLARITMVKKDNADANFIISSEALIDLNTKLMGRMIKHLSAIDDVKVINCVRRQDRYLVSFWSLEVSRMNLALSFNEWAIQTATNNAMLLDYNCSYLKLNSLLKPDAIEFVGFKNLVSGEGPFKNFLRLCGVDVITVEACAEPLHANPSPNLLSLELVRHLTKPPFTELPQHGQDDLLNGIIQFGENHGWKEYAPKKSDIISEKCYRLMQLKYTRTNNLLIEQFPNLEEELRYTPYEGPYRELSLNSIPIESFKELNSKLPKIVDIESFLN